MRRRNFATRNMAAKSEWKHDRKSCKPRSWRVGSLQRTKNRVRARVNEARLPESHTLPTAEPSANRRARDYAISSLAPFGVLATRMKVRNTSMAIRLMRSSTAFSKFNTPEVVEAGQPELESRITAEGGCNREDGWRGQKYGSRFCADVTSTELDNTRVQLRSFVKVTRAVTMGRQAEMALQESEKVPTFGTERTAGDVDVRGARPNFFRLFSRCWTKI